MSARAERFEAVEPHMGTLVRITVHAPDEGVARQAFVKAFERIRELDEKLSDYKSNSEVNRLSAAAPGVWTPVSHDLWRVLDIAQRYARETNGAFDITVGALTALARKAKLRNEAISRDEWSTARNRVGYRLLELKAGHARILKGGVRLDLGGIGKGFAADEALEVLRASGLPSALVAVSGDLALGDAPPGAKGWRVALFQNGSRKEMDLANVGVSSSGASGQGVHILEPFAGEYQDGFEVAVVGPSAAESDAVATGCIAMGLSAARIWSTSKPTLMVLFVNTHHHN